MWAALDAALFFFNHMGPPCGTASRAREIPLTKAQIRDGCYAPKPLRDAQHVRGFPWLTGLELVKVEKANAIYDYCLCYALKCLGLGLYFSIENPRGSWLWSLEGYVKLAGLLTVYAVDFQACCWGSSRPKWTRFLTNMPELQGLAKQCPGESSIHIHKPWGVERTGRKSWKFATASEAEYPLILCNEVARMVSAAAHRCGHPGFDHLHQKSISEGPANKVQRIGAAVQPRGSSVPQLIPEYHWVEEKIVDEKLFETLTVGQLAPAELSEVKAKVLRLSDRGVGGLKFSAVIGAFRSPEEFAAAAVTCLHPFDSTSPICDLLRENVFFTLVEGRLALAKARLDGVKEVAKVVSEAAALDAECVASMDPEMARVMEGKKLASWHRLLVETGYVDAAVAMETVEGFSWTGMPKSSGVFRPFTTLPSMSTESLLGSSRWVSSSILKRVQGSGDDKIDHQLYSETLEERDKGWLSGPLTLPEVDERFPGGWCACRRFGIIQGGKLRCIDDLSECGTNAAYGSAEKLTLMGLDSVAALIRCVHSAVGPDRTVKMRMSDGNIKEGKLHPSWSMQDALSWVGRSLDLTKAYRQLAIKESSRWCAVVAVWNPQKAKPELFAATAMLFGGAAAVYSFNRSSRSLWYLGAKLLRLNWLNFFDDFPMVEPALGCEVSHHAAQAMLRLLGWGFAEGDAKNLAYSPCFETLGAAFDLTGMRFGTAVVKNKPKRLAAITGDIAGLVARNRVRKSEASTLRGKLLYAESHSYGRIAIHAIRVLGEIATGKRSGSPLAASDVATLQWLTERLATAVPRPILADKVRQPIVIFTDAASEENNHTVGGMIYDGLNDFYEYFSCTIEPSLIQEWKQDGAVQIIGPAELYPVWLARQRWGARLRGRRVLFFVDNNGSKDSIVKGHSFSRAGDDIVRAVITQEYEQCSWNWYARVPTHSNPADDPSRMDTRKLDEEGIFTRVFIVQPLSFAGGVAVFAPVQTSMQ